VKRKPFELVQRAAPDLEWRNDWDFVFGELACEGMLLADLRVAPTGGAVELRDHGRGFFWPTWYTRFS
jgi:hypothetical protein